MDTVEFSVHMIVGEKPPLVKRYYTLHCCCIPVILLATHFLAFNTDRETNQI